MGHITPHSNQPPFATLSHVSDLSPSLRSRGKSSWPKTQSIPIPVRSNGTGSILHASTESLKEQYDFSTYQMYHRIKDHRRLQKLNKTKEGILSSNYSSVSIGREMEDSKATIKASSETFDSDSDMIFDLEL
mmetsp:Transcript_4575/g.6596  ORF Transcript_4575/g.6596 Transcript_4575/m.6596 type:complete len:132 (-) Transcript_4575:119-514(-)